MKPSWMIQGAVSTFLLTLPFLARKSPPRTPDGRPDLELSGST